ncbi:MAG: response regulator, partial [Clostridia bacterium]|nr:response regulator [Clostridia bacterium]
MVTILVVDDNKHTRLLLQAVLKNAGYAVCTAENGADALEVLDREHIDLVVLDVMMLHMDGLEFTRTVRLTDSTLPI